MSSCYSCGNGRDRGVGLTVFDDADQGGLTPVSALLRNVLQAPIDICYKQHYATVLFKANRRNVFRFLVRIGCMPKVPKIGQWDHENRAMGSRKSKVGDQSGIKKRFAFSPL